VFEFVRRNTEASVEKQKYYHDRDSKDRTGEVGTLVWRWYPPKAKQKLGLGWTGPYKVLEKVGSSTVKIQKGKGDRPTVVHINDTKPYEGRLSIDTESDSDENSGSSSEEVSDDQSDLENDSVTVERDEQYTPMKTRRGREVKVPQRYSPIL